MERRDLSFFIDPANRAVRDRAEESAKDIFTVLPEVRRDQFKQIFFENHPEYRDFADEVLNYLYVTGRAMPRIPRPAAPPLAPIPPPPGPRAYEEYMRRPPAAAAPPPPPPPPRYGPPPPPPPFPPLYSGPIPPPPRLIPPPPPPRLTPPSPPLRPTNTACPICLEDLVEGQSIHTGPCNHRTHTECYTSLPPAWNTGPKAGQKACPICRYNAVVPGALVEPLRSQQGYGKPHGFGTVSIESQRHNELSYESKRALELGKRRKLTTHSEKDLFF